MTKTTTKPTNPRNAGRKPIDEGERKYTVQCYPRKKIVDALGYEKCQILALEAIEREYNNLK